ncbi:MAG TPA: serine/threonine-protein kinase, partial [Ktedonobacteraceae bacterium]
MQKIFGQYNLTTELAKKHSHSTYLASTTTEPERQVVITVFASSLFRFPHERENLLKKAQRIKELEHPHLAPILDMGIEQEQPFVVREYRPNGSLRNSLKKLSSGRLELGEALTIVSQVGQALVYAHERNIIHGNIIHGNIKPENILLEADGQIVLTDFSLVERKDAIIRDQTSQEYAFCYLAPEQFSGTCDTRSDQYALGCLAYELITGQVPFAAQSLSSMMGHQSNGLPAPLSQSVADLPASLEVAVLKTLANDPDERFFDFSLFLEVLQSVLSPPPAFPLLRSIYAGKHKSISHPIPSAKAENISSPIRKRATKRVASQSSKSSGAPSRAESERIESAKAQALIDASIPLQRKTTSATASPITALQSQLQTSSLSQDTNPLNVENVSLPHPLKGQTPSESSALMLETIPQAEILTVESAIVIP